MRGISRRKKERREERNGRGDERNVKEEKGEE